MYNTYSYFITNVHFQLNEQSASSSEERWFENFYNKGQMWASDKFLGHTIRQYMQASRFSKAWKNVKNCFFSSFFAPPICYKWIEPSVLEDFSQNISLLSIV